MTLFERLLFMPFLFDADNGGGGGDGGDDPAPAGDDDPDKGGDDPAADRDDEIDVDADDFDLDRAKAAIKKKNQEAASLRKRLKDAEPVLEAARQAEEDAKDEKTKLTEAKDEAAQEAAEAKAEVTRLKMAIKYGLDEEDLDLLGTGDEEAIENRAKRLADLGKGQEPENNNGRTPRERLRPGAVPSSEPEETNPDKAAEKVPRSF